MVRLNPDKADFRRLAKLMDPNEVVAGYLQALERDAHRLSLIERRLSRIEKMLVLLGKSVADLSVFNNQLELLTSVVDALAVAQRKAEENPYVPQQNA